ncbi:uncharacterized protein STEHIDRAFT_54487 [Stereum hirsutum FP-91666 SS1]|uniref:uncharacterized protein n=1 Tax=Stereum hirsutum (strain FP-91666) TaxID=721885 RepID=UPI000440D7A3|nr:uncharacterized protein STEHIDRAFT_54487 [Stereum hirsutum FP-91666 SS1]EIM87795.1 hypothetical protein STEHIDRAFT_54487 [Stereum hirsutum FP-91666 SS1]
MSAPIVLLQIGSNPFNTVFEDAHGEAAFTIQERTPTTPNTLVRLRREQLWSAIYHTISGPGATYFYFGPESAPGSGYIVYGNAEAQSMTSVVRKKRGSAMRYFTTHMGKELRWKLSDSSGHMECSDGNKLLAVYQAKHPDLPQHAVLTIQPSALPVVTEVVTTLMLIRMGGSLRW